MGYQGWDLIFIITLVSSPKETTHVYLFFANESTYKKLPSKVEWFRKIEVTFLHKWPKTAGPFYESLYYLSQERSIVAVSHGSKARDSSNNTISVACAHQQCLKALKENLIFEIKCHDLVPLDP